MLVVLLAGVALASAACAAEEEKPWLKPDPAALQRWEAMRFGMFIHWGPVSLTGREIGWSRGAETPIDVYDNLYKRFNPVILPVINTFERILGCG
jgi:alpha-L-fucosidase